MKLFSDAAIADIRNKQAEWEQKELAAALKGRAGRALRLSNRVRHSAEARLHRRRRCRHSRGRAGLPGAYPFVRGVYPTMYRGRPWTIRQVAGFGNPEATNRRYKYMIETGQTGLSTDFDLPTLLGLDSDDPMAFGEVGRVGVAIDTIEDIERLFDGIDLEKISVSLTINPSAWVIYAMFISVAEQRGCDLTKLAGTLQADPLKEYVAQKEWIYPVRQAVRLLRDLIVYSTKATPKINPISLERLSPVRCRRQRHPGDRVHHGFHHRLLRGSHRGRHGHRRLRAPAVVLLHQPPGFLRADLQVQGGAARSTRR